MIVKSEYQVTFHPQFEMKKIISSFLLIVILFIDVYSQQLHHETAHLTILHWNDFHAQNFPFQMTEQTNSKQTLSYAVGGTAALLGYIKHVRTANDNVALFNAGDDFQGTPISTLTSGRSQIELMNLIAPDAVTLGNHEFDYGMDSLIANLARANYPIVCANVVNTATNSTLGIPFLTKTFGKVRVGIVGVTPPDLELLTLKNNLNGYRVRDVDSSLNISIGVLKTKNHPNLTILLSHMGFDQDTLLAARRNDIDIIVGGHSHTALFIPIKKNRTIIVQAGYRGQYLGKLDLTIDLEGDSVLSYAGELIETKVNNVTPDPVAEKKVEEYESVVNEKFGEVIGTLVTPWDRQAGKKVEINVGNFECDVMRAVAKTDIAFHNVGGIRKDLDAGPIKVRDIWEMNPFGNMLVTFSVRGDTLRKMMEWQAAIRPREFAQVSGLQYTYNSSEPFGKNLLSLNVNGQPCVDTVWYSLCTNNYIGSHLYDFFGIDEKSVNILDTGLIDRDVIIDYIIQKKTISSVVEGRIVDVAEKIKK